MLKEKSYSEIVPRLFLGGDYPPQVIHTIDGKDIEYTEQSPYDLVVRAGEIPSENEHLGNPEPFKFPKIEDPNEPGRYSVSVNSFDDVPGTRDLGFLEKALKKLTKCWNRR